MVTYKGAKLKKLTTPSANRPLGHKKYQGMITYELCGMMKNLKDPPPPPYHSMAPLEKLQGQGEDAMKDSTTKGRAMPSNQYTRGSRETSRGRAS